MDKTTLVTEDIEQGRKLLAKLDELEYPISSAFWFFLQDIEEWRLMLASLKVDELGRTAVYRSIIQNLEDIDIPFDSITVISPADAINKLLKIVFRTEPKAVGSIRFSNNVINGTLIKDAYIYRVT